MIVGSALDNLSVINNQYLVCLFNRCQSVRNRYNCFPSGKFRYCCLNEMFILRINTGCCLIQYDDWCVLQYRSCYGDTLFLTSGQASSALSDHRIITIRQFHDEVMTACLFRRFYHFFLRCIRLAKAYVVSYGIVKQINILEYHGYIRQKAVACEFFHIVSSYADTSTIYVIESCDQITYGRFATSRWTYDCSHRILRDFEADILKHLSPALSLSIGKVNISEFDIVMVNLYLSAICINKRFSCQRIQMIQRVIYDCQYMCTVRYRLQ